MSPAHHAAPPSSSSSSAESSRSPSARRSRSKASCHAWRSRACRAAAMGSSRVRWVTEGWYDELPALGGALLPLDGRRVRPQPFQAVVFAVLVLEHVGHEVDEVEEDPPALPPPLASDRAKALGLHRPLDLLGHGADLAIAGPRGDHEVVRDDDQFADVEDEHVPALLGGGCPCRGDRCPTGLRHRPPAKSRPTTTITSASWGWAPSRTCPVPSSLRAARAEGTSSSLVAVILVTWTSKRFAFVDCIRRKPCGIRILATSSPIPGSPTPFNTTRRTSSPPRGTNRSATRRRTPSSSGRRRPDPRSTTGRESRSAGSGLDAASTGRSGSGHASTVPGRAGTAPRRPASTYCH